MKKPINVNNTLLSKQAKKTIFNELEKITISNNRINYSSDLESMENNQGKQGLLEFYHDIIKSATKTIFKEYGKINNKITVLSYNNEKIATEKKVIETYLKESNKLIKELDFTINYLLINESKNIFDTINYFIISLIDSIEYAELLIIES